MDTGTTFYFVPYILCIIPSLLLLSFLKTLVKPPTASRPPPSPPTLPIIGHVHLLTSILPKCFQTLASRYGPLMQLRLGSSTCIVVSNAAVAKEVMKTHELAFASRPEFGSSEHFIYKGSRFIMAEYGPYWRFMKKLCLTKLLAAPTLDRLIHIREEEMGKLMDTLIQRSRKGEASDLSKELTTLTSNIICRMAMSTRCSRNGNEAEEMMELVKGVVELGGKLSIGDALGALGRLDLLGYGKKLEAKLRKFDNPSAELKLTRTDIKSFFLDILLAGTDTQSVATQWAMAELINRPRVFNKLREEIDSIVGSTRLVKESDVPNLPYLQAVVKETLRLHTSAPFILRQCIQDCKIDGYDIKANTRVMISAFAIMQDPNSWEDPSEFIPERFLVNSGENMVDHVTEIKGQDFRYVPFGSGRRGCPGAALAMMVMQMTIGRLVQCFDWRVKDGEKVDLNVGPGFSAEMKTPLVCFTSIHFDPLGEVYARHVEG
uniref:3,9-dihydroxypterocarpan 6A-monooxygenase n=1 Tax=Vitis vinifera TaxID=29760 RepID=F6HII2_VITVI